MTRYTLALAICMILMPQLAGAEEFFESVSAEPGGHLEADLSSGSIRVEPHDEDLVSVEVHTRGFRAGSLELDLEGDGKNARLKADVPRWFGGVRVRVRVRVPERYSLEIDTAGGDIEVEGLEGDVEVDTSGGDISIDGIRGDVEADTSGGTVNIYDIEGDVTGQTSGGNVRVADVTGRVEVETSGGSLRIHDVGGPVQGKTSGGSISARFLETPEGELETSGGSIQVEFPRDAALDLEAETSGGRVRVDADLVVRGSVGSGEVRGRINGGGPELRLSTSGGNITVRAR
jgi:DUF4097 and DUF4098 domain-containing protein YvlB